MPITVNCNCGYVFRAKDKLAGRKVRCPNCGGAVMIGMSRKYGVNPIQEPTRRNNLRMIAGSTAGVTAVVFGLMLLKTSGRLFRAYHQNQDNIEKRERTDRRSNFREMERNIQRERTRSNFR